MAFDDSSLDDYNDVASRLAEFRDKHPDGRLRPADPTMPYHVVRVPNGWCIRCKGSQTVKGKEGWGKCPRCQGSGVRHPDEPQEDVFIVYAAAAHRDAGDTEPGVGMAWEPYPGRTPYTAQSELQNAETSAWGRALLAANVADTRKGVASKDEVRNRVAERDADGWPAGTKPTAAKPAEANGHASKKPMHPAQKIAMYLKRCGVTDDADRLIKVSILAERTDPIASSKELSDETLNRIAGELAACRNPAQLEALLRSKVAAS